MPERLTDRGIAALKPPAKGNHLAFDSAVPGLAVRLYATGTKVFVFDWREPQSGRQRRLTVGRFPVWTIGKARAHVTRLRRRLDVGESVTPEAGSQLADFAEEWRRIVELTRRPSTAKSYLRLLNKHILPRFGNLRPEGLTRNALEAWHGEMAQRTPIEANRALAIFSAFLSWLGRDRPGFHNPTKGIARRPEVERHNYLDAAESASVHVALDAAADRPAALALRLALASGCRIGEALSLTKDQIDAKRALWIKPAATTKQKRVHISPLSPQAIAIACELLTLQPSDYYRCRRVWIQVREALGRPDARIHDLRHSRASALARSSASLPMIGKVLGHTSPQTTQRYLHLVDHDLAELVARTG